MHQPFDPSTLVSIPSPNPKWKAWLWGRRYYYLKKTYTFWYEPLDKYITCEAGIYDGATMALDTKAKNGYPPAWLPHDAVCNMGIWDDGTPIKRIEAAELLAWVLEKTGHNFRKSTWKWATYYGGCDKVKNQ